MYFIRTQLDRGGFKTFSKETAIDAMDQIASLRADAIDFKILDDTEKQISETDLQSRAEQERR